MLILFSLVDPTATYPTGRGCLTLMPYTLVTHYKITVLRPVLLVPSLLRRILSEKLCANKDYMKCDTGIFNTLSAIWTVIWMISTFYLTILKLNGLWKLHYSGVPVYVTPQYNKMIPINIFRFSVVDYTFPHFILLLHW